MKNKIKYIVLAVLLAAISTFTIRAAEDLMAASQEGLSRMTAADPSLQQFISSAAGYAIFPGAGKGGFIVGGAHGKGVVYQNGTAIGTTSMSQATIGAQAGGQSFDELIVFQTPAALESFKSGKFEMAADASAVAVSQGASSSARYSDGVAVFTLPKKGLMVQAAVGGQKFSFEPLGTTK